LVSILVSSLYLSISSCEAISSVAEYQANAKARHTATVSSFSKDLSLFVFPKEEPVNTHFLVTTVALKLTKSQFISNEVSIDIFSVCSAWYS
jgi:hypothetical protein